MDKKTIAEQEVKAYFDNMTEEEKSSFVTIFKQGIAELVSKYEIEAKQLESDILSKTNEEKEIWEQERVGSYSEKEAMYNKRQIIKLQIFAHKNKVRSLKNLIICLQNGGTAVEITDQYDFAHQHIADFREVKTSNILFNEETILVEETPIYIPVIDEENFKHKGYVFDAIRYNKNSYLLSTSKYEESKSFEGYSHFVIVTLDQLVLISEYYYLRAKAHANLKAKEQSQRAEDYYDNLSFEKREKFLNQKGFYHSIPANVKKKITQVDYELLSLEEKEKLYKPFKKYGAERLKSKLEDNQMWVSFHDMYQRFVNKDAHPVNKLGQPQVGKRAGLGLFGNPEIFTYWKVFREMMDYKIKDIRAQREYLSEAYKTAIETSFGESNTSIELKEKYGILIKRQNGDQIKPIETNQIEEGFSEIQKVFGNLKDISLKRNLKISHTGKKMVFSSGKAIGVYISSMGTIAVSDKYGDERFRSTFSHEIAHFIDNYIGELSGKFFASDDYENTAGILAFTFRNNMNKPKSLQNDYINSTCECFARAMQQYFGIETLGDDASYSVSASELDRTEPLFSNDNFVPKEPYYAHIKPLVEKFLEENKDIFKFTVDIDNTNVPLPIGSQITEQVEPKENAEIQEALEVLEILLDTATKKEKKEIQEAIEVLQLLLN